MLLETSLSLAIYCLCTLAVAGLVIVVIASLSETVGQTRPRPRTVARRGSTPRSSDLYDWSSQGL